MLSEAEKTMLMAIADTTARLSNLIVEDWKEPGGLALPYGYSLPTEKFRMQILAIAEKGKPITFADYLKEFLDPHFVSAVMAEISGMPISLALKTNWRGAEKWGLYRLHVYLMILYAAYSSFDEIKKMLVRNYKRKLEFGGRLSSDDLIIIDMDFNYPELREPVETKADKEKYLRAFEEAMNNYSGPEFVRSQPHSSWVSGYKPFQAYANKYNDHLVKRLFNPRYWPERLQDRSGARDLISSIEKTMRRMVIKLVNIGHNRLSNEIEGMLGVMEDGVPIPAEYFDESSYERKRLETLNHQMRKEYRNISSGETDLRSLREFWDTFLKDYAKIEKPTERRETKRRDFKRDLSEFQRLSDVERKIKRYIDRIGYYDQDYVTKSLSIKQNNLSKLKKFLLQSMRETKRRYSSWLGGLLDEIEKALSRKDDNKLTDLLGQASNVYAGKTYIEPDVEEQAPVETEQKAWRSADASAKRAAIRGYAKDLPEMSKLAVFVYTESLKAIEKLNKEFTDPHQKVRFVVHGRDGETLYHLIRTFLPKIAKYTRYVVTPRSKTTEGMHDEEYRRYLQRKMPMTEPIIHLDSGFVGSIPRWLKGQGWNVKAIKLVSTSTNKYKLFDASDRSDVREFVLHGMELSGKEGETITGKRLFKPGEKGISFKYAPPASSKSFWQNYRALVNAISKTGMKVKKIKEGTAELKSIMNSLRDLVG